MLIVIPSVTEILVNVAARLENERSLYMYLIENETCVGIVRVNINQEFLMLGGASKFQLTYVYGYQKVILIILIQVLEPALHSYKSSLLPGIVLPLAK